MFAKKPERGMGDPKLHSIIGRGLAFTGNIVDAGTTEFSGKLEGDVQCHSIVLNDTAQIVGSVTAEEVVVRGRVDGLIRSLRVTLQGEAYVVGEIHCQSMAVEHGAFFEGKTRRIEPPLMGGDALEEGGASIADTTRLVLLPKQPIQAAK